MKHTILIVAATVAVIAVGGYVSIPLLSDLTNLVANKKS